MAINRIFLHSRTIWEKSCQAASIGPNLKQIYDTENPRRINFANIFIPEG
jgi:hypothetical protein